MLGNVLGTFLVVCALDKLYNRSQTFLHLPFFHLGPFLALWNKTCFVHKFVSKSDSYLLWGCSLFLITVKEFPYRCQQGVNGQNIVNVVWERPLSSMKTKFYQITFCAIDCFFMVFYLFLKQCFTAMWIWQMSYAALYIFEVVANLWINFSRWWPQLVWKLKWVSLKTWFQPKILAFKVHAF